MTFRLARFACALVVAAVVVTGTTAIARADPTLSEASPIALGAVLVGNTTSHMFAIDEANVLPDDLDLDTSACPDGFAVTPATDLAPSSIHPAAVTAAYTPAGRTGALTCHVLVVDHVGAAERLAFDVTASGVGPALTAPATVAFAATRWSTGAVATQTLTLTNSGDDDALTITALTFASGAEYSFLTPPTLPITLTQNASQTFTLVFAPTAAGTRTDTLTIASNAAGAPTTAVALTGTGTNAVIAAGSVAFGTVVDAGAASTKSISIANAGALPLGTLAVTQATLADTSGWFAFASSTGCTGTTCALSDAVGTTPATLAVTCKPTPLTASGTQLATVTFASDSDPFGSGANVATLSCTAGRPDIALGAPAPALAYGSVAVGQAATISFSVHNGGTSALTYAVAETGASYVVTSGACAPCTIAPAGADQTISVKFTPTASGEATGSLTLTTNDPDPGNGSIAVSLDGTGTASQITGAPTTLLYGNVDVGKSLPKVLTVSNSGNATLNISGAALSGTGAASYAVTDGLLGAQQVAPGASITWTIKCAPTAPGALPATFAITSDSLANPTANVTLSCAGQQGQLAVTPTPFDFGGVRDGDKVSHTFTVANTGNTPVSGITAALTDATLGYSILTLPAATIAGGGSSTLVVQFDATNAGAGGADQVVVSGVWGTSPATPVTATLDLNGADKAAGYDVSAPTLVIGDANGDVRWDETAQGSFTIALTDAQPVKITSLDIAPDPATMTVSGEVTRVSLLKNGVAATLPIELDALTDVITVGLQVAPADRTGPIRATVTVTSDLAMNPTRQVVVTSTSVTPMLALTPATGILAFGQVDVDGPPATLPITIKNTGDGPLSVGTITTANPQGAFAFSVPAGLTAIAAGASATITVTYAPTLEETDTAAVLIPLAGIFMTPDGSQTIAISGQGINRHLTTSTTAVVFPPTFVYPTTPPQQIVHVTNTGLAPLHIHMAEVTGSTAFALAEGSTGMITVPGNGSNDFVVTFDPITAGQAATGLLELDSDATPKGAADAVAMITLSGMGIDRDVVMGPTKVNLGTIGIGISRRITDVIDPGIQVTSLDEATTFHIVSITADDARLTLIGAPQGVDLQPTQTDTFDGDFTPTDAGTFAVTLSLFLDADPNPTASVLVTGNAVFVDAQGGGGCAAGGRAGPLGALLVLGAAVLATRRRRAAAVITSLAALAGGSALAEPPVAPAAATQSRDLDASVFHPMPATTGGAFGVQSAAVGAPGDWAVSALLSYASNPVDLASGGTDDYAIANRTLIDLGGAYAFLGRFEVAAHMPFYAQSGDVQLTPSPANPGDSEAPTSGTARGDLALGAKARLYPSAGRGGPVQLGLAAGLTLPTATADQFAGVSDPVGRVLGLVTITPPGLGERLAIHVNAGGVLRARETYANIDQKSGVAWGASATFRLLDRLWLDGEVFGELVPSGVRTAAPTDGVAPTAALDTMESLVGVRYALERRATLGVAIGRGLNDGFGSPAVRAVFSLTFAAGARALAPIHPPAPPRPDGDSDGDGILDSRDKCPFDPEDKDGFQDEDGCPDPDNDQDGIPDASDKCPNEPEDKDGFQDEDGCPDLDNDQDGIPDARDKCPNVPEDKDGFQDEDGCPDPDNDHDGIPDWRDRCPNEPETINGILDDDGCPDAGDPLVIVSPDRLDLLDAVKWNGAKLSRQSLNLMGQIAATLRAHDEVLRVRVTSHVQPSGNADKDQELSEKRAEAARDWLVQWGIAGTRVEAKGFGGTKPLVPADGKGAAGINDRLELIILERK